VTSPPYQPNSSEHLYKVIRGDPSLTFGATNKEKFGATNKENFGAAKRRNSGDKKRAFGEIKGGVLNDKKGGRGHRGGSR